MIASWSFVLLQLARSIGFSALAERRGDVIERLGCIARAVGVHACRYRKLRVGFACRGGRIDRAEPSSEDGAAVHRENVPAAGSCRSGRPALPTALLRSRLGVL